MTVIVVFGDINIDIVMRVESLPRRGETVNGEDHLLVPGGKGANQAAAAALAGAPVAMFGQVGEDEFAPAALEILDASGVNLAGVQRSKRPTGCAAVWVESSGENAIVVAAGANHETIADQVPDSLLTTDTILAMQMHVTLEENWKLARRAKALGARIFLNAAPAGPVPNDILKLVDVLVVNELEGEAIAEQEEIEFTELMDIPREISARFGNTCVLTLGGAGATAFDRTGGLSISALPISPIDTVGAGDAFVGGLAAAVHKGVDLRTALHFASISAGICCTKVGAQTSLPNAAAIEARLTELALPSTIG
jgi:ribokinase